MRKNTCDLQGFMESLIPVIVLCLEAAIRDTNDMKRSLCFQELTVWVRMQNKKLKHC